MTYRLRSAVIVLATIILGGIFNSHGGLAISGLMSRRSFDLIALLASLFCLFEGARQTADCLSRESREGTLGLLFLADISPLQVVTGKLVSTSLNSFYGLLALLPVVTVPVMMGGVSGGEVIRLALALINTLWFSLAAGLWVSARNRNQHRARVGTGLLGLASAFAPAAASELGHVVLSDFLAELGP